MVGQQEGSFIKHLFQYESVKDYFYFFVPSNQNSVFLFNGDLKIITED